MNGNNGWLCYVSKFSYLLTDKDNKQVVEVKSTKNHRCKRKQKHTFFFFNRKIFWIVVFLPNKGFYSQRENDDKIYSLRLATNDKLSSCRDVVQIFSCIRKHLFSTASSIPSLWFPIYRTCIKKQSSKYGLRKLLRF